MTSLMIGAAIEVHRVMGPGLLESVYQRCLTHELALRELVCQPHARLPLVYKGVNLSEEEDRVMDFYFPSQLVVELKAVEKLHPIHEAQLLSYMRLSKTPKGLLLNFNTIVLKQGIKRMVL